MINAADFIKWLEVFNVNYGPSGGTGTVDTGAINELAYYAAAGDTVSGLSTANDGVLVTDGTGVPSISQTLPTQVQDNITQLGALTSFSIDETVVATAGTSAGYIPITVQGTDYKILLFATS